MKMIKGRLSYILESVLNQMQREPPSLDSKGISRDITINQLPVRRMVGVKMM